jgi:hypothetical protein
MKFKVMPYLLLTAIILLILAVPNLLSRPTGQQWVRDFIRWSTQGKIEVERSQLSWSGPQKFTHLQWRKNVNSPSSDFDEVTLNHSLPSLFINAYSLLRKREGDKKLDFSLRAEKLSLQGISSAFSLDPTISQKLLALVGPVAALEGSGLLDNDKFTFSFHANSPLASVNTSGEISDGQLTLQKPFNATIVTNPDFTKEILQPIIPLLNTTLRTRNPIQIEIAPEGFILPLNKFDISSLKINKGTIDLGKIELKNPDILAKLFKLLNLSKKISPDDNLNLWLTPTYFSLKRGILEINRVDILLMDQYPLAVWGSVNLPQDRLQMMIGLSPQILGKSLASALLNGNSLLPLPLTGSTKKASIDTDALAGQIGALALRMFQENIKGKDKADSDRIPPSTTNPLPWN